MDSLEILPEAPTSQPWTCAELATADQLVADGWSLAQVGEAVGRSPWAVAMMRYRRRRNGERVPAAKPNQERRRRAPGALQAVPFDVVDTDEL